jgi:heme-degrading monooxygenase HmoA
MIKHIVLFNVKEGENKDAVAAIAKEALEPLADKIEGLISLEVCRCFNGCDFALYSELESKEALAFYAPHPLHEEAKSKFFHLLSSRMAADYEV